MYKPKNIFFLTIVFSLLGSVTPLKIQGYTIMLAPSHSPQGGRIIEGKLENNIATQWANTLRHELINQLPGIEVFLTQHSDEEPDHLEVINRINKNKPDLVISLNLFPHGGVPQLYLYYMLYNPLQDLGKQDDNLSFIPYDQAHRSALPATRVVGEKVVQYLQNNKPNTYELKGLLGVPYKPLIGLQVPALGLELGSSHPQGWELTLNSLIEAIKHIVPL